MSLYQPLPFPPLPRPLNKRILLFAVGAVVITSPVSAREFNSRLKLKVFVRGAGDVPDRLIGFTPLKKGRHIHVPEGKLWYVRPIGALIGIQLDNLARDLKAGMVPGLDLSDHWELSNESLRHFRSLAQLRMLDVSRTRISDGGIQPLAFLKRLEVLALPEGITDRAADRLKKLHHLRELNLDQARVTDAGMAVLSAIPTLENLDVSSTRVTDSGLANLSRLPSLKRLVLGSLVTDACAPHLRAMKTLEEIDITQTQIGEKGLTALADLPALKAIYMNRQVKDAELKPLAQARALRVLDLTRAGITDAGVKSLGKIKTLEELSLGQTAVGNGCLPYLAELPRLRMLELSDTHVTSAGLAPLARLKTLEVLSLSWQTLSREDLQAMAKLKQLKAIVLNGVPLPRATMAQLRRLGAPSPWDHVAGLERARYPNPQPTDRLALSTPVFLSEPSLAMRVKPEIPQPSMLPAQRQDIAATPSKPGPFAESRPLPPPFRQKPGAATHPSAVSLGERVQVSTSAAVPVEAAAMKSTEDSLLQMIAVQSNPARGGTFSGLSGMRQIRETGTLASLNTVADGAPRQSILDDQDNPGSSLGEISVGVVGHKRQ